MAQAQAQVQVQVQAQAQAQAQAQVNLDAAKVEAQKMVEESMKAIAELDAREKEIDYNVRCTYDVGAGSTTPEGPNGKYVRQCLRYAIFDVTPPFCYQHAKKALLTHVIKSKSEFFRLEEKPMLTSGGAATGMYDPKTITLTLKEFNDTIKGQPKKGCTDIAPAKDGGVFGRKAAICKAFEGHPGLKTP
jgi:hypothetical protein